MHVARFVTKRTFFSTVAWSSTRMFAIRKVTAAWLLAVVMLFLDNLRALAITTFAAFGFARMTAGL